MSFKMNCHQPVLACDTADGTWQPTSAPARLVLASAATIFFKNDPAGGDSNPHSTHVATCSRGPSLSVRRFSRFTLGRIAVISFHQAFLVPFVPSDASIRFSLELYVQHVEYFPQAAPAHPAVAFRLLDFPSVVIYGPSPEKSPVVDAAASLLAAKPNAVDILNPANFSAHHVLSFERGKSCLFTLGRQSLQRLLQHVPLYLMLVDTITGLDQSAPSALASAPAELPPAHLLGSTAVDLSEFAQQVRESSKNLQHTSMFRISPNSS
jgi:hypothetical protein